MTMRACGRSCFLQQMVPLTEMLPPNEHDCNPQLPEACHLDISAAPVRCCMMCNFQAVLGEQPGLHAARFAQLQHEQ